MINKKLFEAFYIVTGGLSSKTIDAVLKDLEGWTGPEIKAARQALSKRKAQRGPLNFKGAEGGIKVAVFTYLDRMKAHVADRPLDWTYIHGRFSVTQAEAEQLFAEWKASRG